jgi:acetyl esterase/lipase
VSIRNASSRDEDVTYAQRLQQAGVATTLHVVPGAYHNFDSIQAKAAVSVVFGKARTTALDKALNSG